MNFHSKAKKNQKILSIFMQYTTLFDIKAAQYCKLGFKKQKSFGYTNALKIYFSNFLKEKVSLKSNKTKPKLILIIQKFCSKNPK